VFILMWLTLIVETGYAQTANMYSTPEQSIKARNELQCGLMATAFFTAATARDGNIAMEKHLDWYLKQLQAEYKTGLIPPSAGDKLVVQTIADHIAYGQYYRPHGPQTIAAIFDVKCRELGYDKFYAQLYREVYLKR